MKKIRLSNNRQMTNAEYDKACRICDIIGAIISSGGTQADNAAPAGLFWGSAPTDRPLAIWKRKSRREIDHLSLLNTRFRDFPTIAYAQDDVTPAPDYSVRRYCRLISGVPNRWRLRLPCRFGEIGWNIDGHPVSRATAVFQERINLLYGLGILDAFTQSQHRRYLEVGGGAGELAFAIARAVPGSTLYDCDLPESLCFNAITSAIRLPLKKHLIYVGSLPMPSSIDDGLIVRSPQKAATLPDAIISIPHFLLDDFLPHLRVDLAFNAWSFAEMSPHHVRRYAVLLKTLLGDCGVMADYNGNLSERGGSDAKAILANVFPHRKRTIRRGHFGHPLTLWGSRAGILNALKYSRTSKRSAIRKSLNDFGDKPDIEFRLEHWDMLESVINPTRFQRLVGALKRWLAVR